MIEKLGTKYDLASRLQDLVLHPGKTVEDIRQKAKDLIQKAVQLAGHLKTELQHGISSEQTSKWLKECVSLEEKDRRQAFSKVFNETLDRDFESMECLLAAISRVDFIELLEDDILLPLQIDYELLTEAISTAQAHPNFHSWMEYLKRKPGAQSSTQLGIEEINLNGAALPDLFPKIKQYEDLVLRHIGGRGGRQGESFSAATKAFKKISLEIFGDEVEAFYGFGTLNTFKSLVLRFWEYYPQADLIATPNEYLPMYYQIKDHRHSIDMPNTEFSEEDLMTSIFTKAKSVRGGSENNDPIVLLVSSALRGGGRLLDTDKIASLVAAENEKAGFKMYHLWIDGSQDSRVIKKADIVFYSKRHGGTGASVALANKETYPEDKMDIKEALKTRSGYRVPDIARIIASLFCIKTRIGHQFSSLLKPESIALWYYKGGGSFLQQEIDKAQGLLKGSQILADLFEMKTTLPSLESGQWRIDSIIKLEATPLGHEKLDLNKLQQDLGDLGVYLSSFNLEHCESDHEKPSYAKLMQIFESENFDLEAFLEATEDFQKFYSEWIVTPLLPQDNRQDAEFVKNHFKNAVSQHDFLRLFLTAVHREGTLSDFVKRLERAVSQQIPTS